MPTLLVLTPLHKEFSLLVEALKMQGQKGQERLIGRVPTMIYLEGGLVLGQGGHGKTQFAIHTQHLLHHLPEVKLVICAGAAGGLTETLAIGDIVVATATIEHDYHLKFVRRPLPRFTGHEASLSLFQRLSLSLNQNFHLHLGLIASGDEDIVDPERARELQQKTGALAVAWEGAGGARVCQFYNLPFLEIRAITDIANKEASANFEQNLSLAMTNLATILMRFLNCGSRD